PAYQAPSSTLDFELRTLDSHFGLGTLDSLQYEATPSPDRIENAMSIRDEDIVLVDPTPATAAESFYLPEVFRGLGTTLKHLVGSIGKGRMNKAMEYPEVRREDLPVDEGGLNVSNFRGVH